MTRDTEPGDEPAAAETRSVTHNPTMPDGVMEASLSQIQQLLENEHLWYQLMSEGAVEGTALISDGIIFLANRQLASMLGCDPPELTGASIARFVDESAVAEARARLRMGVTRPFEMIVRRKDGSTFPAEIHATMVEVGGQWFRVTNVIDISERKRAEGLAREQDARLRAIFNQSPNGLALVGLNFELLETNRTLCLMLGYEPSDLAALTFPEITHPDDVELCVKLSQMLFAGAIPRFTIENRFVGKDRRAVPVRLTGSVVQDETGAVLYALAAIEDLSEQKKLEEELEQARAELEERAERRVMGRNPYGLTLRELTVLHKIASGKADKEIAAELMISPYTAQKHVANILAKMTGSSRTEAAVRAVREGLLG